MSLLQSKIRKDIRVARRSLTPFEQQAAARRISRLLLNHPLYRCSRRIAFYWPHDGEIDITPALAQALASEKSCYLPVLYRGGKNRLLFGRTTADWRFFSLNRFGIPEPDIVRNGWVFASELDLVLAPLVAFDDEGNRIGMGGGFYDSSLHHLRLQRNWQRPYVVGVAHELQHLSSIGRNAWDVPLRGAITDKQVYQFS